MSDDFDDIDAFVLPAEHGREAAGPMPMEFQPWHKPRKQWVRAFVLQRHVRDLTKELKLPPDSPFFRYLSLPGDDLLDIRVIAPMLNRKGLILNYVGFNSVGRGTGRDIRLSLAENEIRNLDGVYRDSKVYRDRIENVGVPESLHWIRVRDCGPYHAINIDLCDHIAAKPTAEAPTYINAIAQIVELQLRRSRDPWLLFIATCVAPGLVEAGNLAAFIAAITDNIRKSPDFENGLREVLCRKGGELEAALMAPNDLGPEKFRDLFTVGFGKWLLQYMGSATPPTRLTLLRSCHYPVGEDNADLMTIAFRCDPVVEAPVDRYKLVGKEDKKPGAPDEIAWALELLDRCGDTVDLHDMLGKRPDLYAKLFEASRSLLQDAHYPVEKYEDWLRECDPLGGLLPNPVAQGG